MKAGMMFVTGILCIDAFFASYFVGLHSRTVDVEDPSMKPIPKAAPAKPEHAKKEEAAKKDTASTTPTTAAKKATKATKSTKSQSTKKKKHPA